MLLIVRRVLPYVVVLFILGATTSLVRSILIRVTGSGESGGLLSPAMLGLTSFGIACGLIFFILFGISLLMLWLSVAFGRDRDREDASPYWPAMRPSLRDGDLRIERLSSERQSRKNIAVLRRSLG
jgi:hypothetical protein